MARVVESQAPRGLLPVVRHTLAENALTVELQEGTVATVRAFTDGQEYPREVFDAFLVKPKYFGQLQVVGIHLRGSSTTLGYVFPLTALQYDTSHQNKWVKVYARAAVDALLRTDMALGYVTTGQFDRFLEGVDVTELFPPDLGIVVLGRDELHKESCDSAMIRLMIQEHSIRLVGSPPSRIEPETIPDYESRISLRRGSAHLADRQQQCCSLIDLAYQQSRAPARFLTLYQIIESFIAHVFQHDVREAIHDPDLQQNLWELREHLNNISNEKWRMRRLVSDFLPNRSSDYGDVLAGLTDSCVTFLQEIGELPPPAPTSSPPATPPAESVVLSVVPKTPVAQSPVEVVATVPSVVPPDSGVIAHDPAESKVQSGQQAAAATDTNPSVTTANEQTEPPHQSHPLEQPEGAQRGDMSVVAPVDENLAQPLVQVGSVEHPEQAPPPILPVNSNQLNVDWADALYKVRNLLVHRQWQMNLQTEEGLSNVCVALERLCYQILSGFASSPNQPVPPQSPPP